MKNFYAENAKKIRTKKLFYEGIFLKICEGNFENLLKNFKREVVRTEGLEPTCREALDPKSSASANFATSA